VVKGVPCTNTNSAVLFLFVLLLLSAAKSMRP
jgi:hypothetical protein